MVKKRRNFDSKKRNPLNEKRAEILDFVFKLKYQRISISNQLNTMLTELDFGQFDPNEL